MRVGSAATTCRQSQNFTMTVAFARRRTVGGCEGTRRVLCLPTLHIAGTFGLCGVALRLTAACATARPSVAAHFMPRMGLEADSGTRLEQRSLQRAELRAVQRGIHGHQHRGRGRRLQVCARHRLYVLHRLLHQLRAGLRALAAAVRRRLPWCINYYTRFCWKRGEAATASLAAATLCGRGRDHAKRGGACAAARASHARQRAAAGSYGNGQRSRGAAGHGGACVGVAEDEEPLVAVAVVAEDAGPGPHARVQLHGSARCLSDLERQVSSTFYVRCLVRMRGALLAAYSPRCTHA